MPLFTKVHNDKDKYKDKGLKENTTYFSGEMEEVIEEKDEVRDLGIIMQNDATFTRQIEKASTKRRVDSKKFLL